MSLVSDGFMTNAERAAAVALEAVRRNIWTQEIGLAFVAYCGDDEERVDHWAKKLLDVLDWEDSVRAAAEQVLDAEINMRDAKSELDNAIHGMRCIEIQTGVITTGRTKLFGDREVEDG